MELKLISTGLAVFVTCVLLQCINAASIGDRISLIEAETSKVFNGIYQNQIDFWEKVKLDLPANTQRVDDISANISEWERLINDPDPDVKTGEWHETAKELKKLSVNVKSETELTDEEYEKILIDNGIEKLTASMLKETGAYIGRITDIAFKE